MEEIEKLKKEKTAEYFYGLSKLSFAGLVIGILVPLGQDSDLYPIIFAKAIIGSILTMVFARIGFLILNS